MTHWREVCKLGYAFPNLESLVLADCPIKTLDLEPPYDEQGNHQAPEYLRSESECESSESKRETAHDSFRRLKFLNLNSTLLSTWDDIERLAKFPDLQRLRIQVLALSWCVYGGVHVAVLFQGCPLWDSNEYTEHERRQLLIARLPNVQMLNGGGNIEHDEREDAERAFIRYYIDKPESDRPDR